MTEIIRFLTAGNVDDGKSTLIGRLLYDTNSLYQDQIAEVKKTTDKSFNGDLDFSLFLDGLTSERAQKITIDVAYRYFSYKGKKFIIADSPGHEQYTKNMTVAAANSEIVIILIDVNKGIKTQTIRHTYISHLFGIKNIIVAVNKMDLVGFDQVVFDKIRKQYLEKVADLKFDSINFVPISAVLGTNIVEKNKKISWYKGESIVEYLLATENKNIAQNAKRLQVQNVVKHDTKRYYQGTLSSGALSVGDEIIVYPAKKHAKIIEIIHSEDSISSASKGQSLAISLDREIDLDRGGLISDLENKPYYSNYFGSYLIWFSENEFDTKKEYIIKLNHNYVRASIDAINYIIDANTLKEYKSEKLKQNQIAYVDISLSQNLAFDAFRTNKYTGSFLLIEKNTNETLACGVISESSRDAKLAPKDKEQEFLLELSCLVKKHFGQSGHELFINNLKN